MEGQEEIVTQQQPEQPAEPQGQPEGQAPQEPTTVPEKDYKELLADYTRKSQELAAIKSQSDPKAPVQKVEVPWEKDPTWDAKSYQDLAAPLAAKIKEEVWQSIIDEGEREEREAAERQQFVEREVEQLKAIDPSVNVNKVLAHAQKYAFSSLIPAYQNMAAIEEAVARAEERTLRNVKSRSAEPVGSPSAQPGTDIAFPPELRTGAEKARWLIRNSKG